MSVDFRVGERNSIAANAAASAHGGTTAGVSWSEEGAGPNGQLSSTVKLSASPSQDRSVDVRDRLPWADASFNWQQLNGSNIYEPSLQGALAFLGRNLYAVRRVDETESFGLVRIPGVGNVRVKLNDSLVGTTNRRGELLLRNLTPYKLNEIELEDVPIFDNVADPVRVIPGKTSPLALNLRIASHGAVTFNAVDAHGIALPVGGWLEGPARYPIGYGGRVFIGGPLPGTHQLHGTNARGERCTIVLHVPQNVDDVPDLGVQRCING